jgi:phytoene dehydrogenase-like protein
VVTLLDRRFPGFADKVEMRDVVTPMKWDRYTGNWQGSFEGWLVSTNTFRMRMSKTLPKLENFYIAGQWVDPDGIVPATVMSGCNITQIICNKDKRQFTTTVPYNYFSDSRKAL